MTLNFRWINLPDRPLATAFFAWIEDAGLFYGFAGVFAATEKLRTLEAIRAAHSQHAFGAEDLEVEFQRRIEQNLLERLAARRTENDHRIFSALQKVDFEHFDVFEEIAE